ncbi:MAG: hypothetical protein EOO87_11195 [Pedobacter sp.]|nr:MAG: hypothetical protein EOO87_11195 [Pedobacter sp.]
MKTTIYSIFVMLSLSACNFTFNTPEQYFDQTALNSNAISRFGSNYFKTYVQYTGDMQASTQFNTCEKYLTNYSIALLENNIKKVKALSLTTETKLMIEASNDLNNYVLESYKTDHMKVAKLIDAKAPQEQIDQALAELDDKSYDGFAMRFDKLWTIAEKYAADNNIKLTTLSGKSSFSN